VVEKLRLRESLQPLEQGGLRLKDHVLVEAREYHHVDLEPIAPVDELAANNFEVDDVLLTLNAGRSLGKVDLEELLPLLDAASLPELKVFVLEPPVGQDAELGLARNQGDCIVCVLHKHHAQRAGDPFCPHDGEWLAGFLAAGMHVVDGVGTKEGHAAAGDRLFDDTVLGLLLDEEIDVTIVHQVGNQRQLSVNHYGFDVAPL